jgi:hypothetical protein
VYAGALLRAREHRTARVEADDFLDLALCLFGLRPRQIDLVDDRDDLQVVLDREIGVGQRLRLDTLRRVHEQQGPFAGGERTRDFVREIHVTRGVDQIQDVRVLVVCLVRQPDGVRLDRDAPLTLEVHRIEHLRFHLAGLERPRDFEEAVRECGFAVVNVSDDREVADEALIHCGR